MDNFVCILFIILGLAVMIIGALYICNEKPIGILFLFLGFASVVVFFSIYSDLAVAE